MSVETDPLPPAPQHTAPVEERTRLFSQPWMSWINALREKINVINDVLLAIGAFSGTGLISITGSTVEGRTITGTTGNIEVADGDGISGDPTIDLVDTGVTPGSYTNADITVDAKGRITAASDGSGGGGGGITTLPVLNGPMWLRGNWMQYVLSMGSASSGILNIGFQASIQGAQGSGSAVAFAVTNAFTRQTRYQYASAAGAGSSASVYNSAAYACGDSGHFTAQRWGWADAAAVANARGFVGLRAAVTAPGNVDPSTLVDIVGFGCDTGDTNLHFMHNDGAGSATKIDLGANFPANSISTDFYETQILCLPASGEVSYYIRNITTGNTTNGTVNTNLPGGTTLLAITAWRNNGTTALAVRLHDGGWLHATSLEG